MSRYTIELRYIEEDKNFELFPTDFPFYVDDDNLRQDFIKKFYNEYRFREIGFETIGRFKSHLLSKLYNIMPYYEQYYKTILTQNSMDFMNTKDITETFTREIQGENNISSVSNSNNSINSSTNSNEDSMSYDTPNTQINDITKYPTFGTDNKSDSTSESTSTGEVTGTQTGTNTLLETTTFNSRGNLGVSSDGFLLEKWREVIVNIDMLLLGELEDLFFQIF